MADDVLADYAVPGTKSVFVLGCLEKRVTLYAQQVRALNLVDALLDAGRIRKGGSVAVVGGGAAGMTAAAALAVAAPELAEIHLYETQPELLHLQAKNSSRYLHPHLYDWPAPNALRPDAGLPLLDWSAGPASSVAQQLDDAFRHVRERSANLDVRAKRHVERVEAGPVQGCRITVTNDPQGGGMYDLAILSIGFGYERDLSERNVSYWSPAPLAGPNRTGASSSAVLVSGNGDGGLVDFLTAALPSLTHEAICKLVTTDYDLTDVRRVLMEVEEVAWTANHDFDIYEAYQAGLPDVLPNGILLDLAKRLRSDATIRLHTREARLFRRDTAVLNRFGVFLIIEAARNAFVQTIEVRTGTEFDGSPFGDPVRFSDGSTFGPSSRVLRFGNDADANFAPFQEHIEHFRAARAPSPAGYRPATPALTESARARFAARTVSSALSAAPCAGGSPSAPDAVAPSEVRVSLVGTRSVTWSGDVAPGSAPGIWGDGAPPTTIVAEMTVADAGPLAYVLARLVVHAPGCRFHGEDSHGWTAFLNTVRGRALPGPDVDVRLQVRRPPLASRQLPHVASQPANELAAYIHLALDFDVLTRLNTLVDRALDPSRPSDTGWPIEAGLRASLRARWLAWHAQLGESPAKLRRFLSLLVCVDDEPELGPAVLVRVGPRTVQGHMMRAVLMALAFGACTDDAVNPSPAFPGNLAAPPTSTLASGVAWLDGVKLGPEAQLRRWTTDVVLLSELGAPAQLLAAGLPRLDQPPDQPATVRQVALAEQALVVGGDSTLLRALAQGEHAVRSHFRALLLQRARAAAKLLT